MSRPPADLIKIRFAAPGDARDLERLAQLDSAPAPSGPTLVAEEHGEIVAALALDDGRAIADPFRRTAETVRLLELRASQLRRAPTRRRESAHLHPRAVER